MPTSRILKTGLFGSALVMIVSSCNTGSETYFRKLGKVGSATLSVEGKDYECDLYQSDYYIIFYIPKKLAMNRIGNLMYLDDVANPYACPESTYQQSGESVSIKSFEECRFIYDSNARKPKPHLKGGLYYFDLGNENEATLKFPNYLLPEIERRIKGKQNK